MLTGDVSTTAGDAYLSGHSVTWLVVSLLLLLLLTLDRRTVNLM